MKTVCLTCYPPKEYPEKHKNASSGYCFLHGSQFLGEIRKAIEKYEKRKKTEEKKKK